MYSQIMPSPVPLCFVLLFRVTVVALPQAPAPAADDYSGMYTFVRDGEFLQVTIEAEGKVTGFVSRFGDSESDRGVFLDQFFKSGKLERNHLSFATENIHGTWFEFEGDFERGAGKRPDEEDYYRIRGKLTRFQTDAEKKVSQQARQVEFKSFPRDQAMH
jgi:hypothetical protein